MGRRLARALLAALLANAVAVVAPHGKGVRVALARSLQPLPGVEVADCSPGDHVDAEWAGNGHRYAAEVDHVNDDGTITVKWDDGGDTHRTVPAAKVHKGSLPCGEARHDHRRLHDYQRHDDHGYHQDKHGNGAGARSIAIGLLAAAWMIPAVAHMVLAGGTLGQVTLQMLDTFVSIFLAVLWFNCFQQIITTFRINEAFPYAAEVVNTLLMIVLYGVANVIAYTWRNEEMQLMVFCGVGANFIAFQGIAAGAHSQHEVSSNLDNEIMAPVLSFLFCAGFFGFLVAIFAVARQMWHRNSLELEGKDKVMETMLGMELDILGLVIAYLITQAVRHALTGSYPEHASNPSKHQHVMTHTAMQRWFMLCWAAGLTVLAVFAVPKLSRLAAETGKAQEWVATLVHLSKLVLVMCIAWGYLLWGEWQILEYLFPGQDEMFGHMFFASLATIVCVIILFIVAKSINVLEYQPPAVRETNVIVTTSVSLATAWSWQHCFNVAFDIIGETYQVGYGGLVPKLIMAIVIPCIMLPAYVKHIKTEVIKNEQAASLANDALSPSNAANAGRLSSALAGGYTRSKTMMKRDPGVVEEETPRSA
jgi:hypothetical protein